MARKIKRIIARICRKKLPDDSMMPEYDRFSSWAMRRQDI